MVSCLFCNAQLIQAFQHVQYQYLLCSTCLLKSSQIFQHQGNSFNNTKIQFKQLKHNLQHKSNSILQNYSSYKYYLQTFLFKRISILKQSIQTRIIALQNQLQTFILKNFNSNNCNSPKQLKQQKSQTKIYFQLFFQCIESFFQYKKQEQLQMITSPTSNNKINPFANHPHSKMGGSSYLKNLDWLGNSLNTIGSTFTEIKNKASQMEIKPILQKTKELSANIISYNTQQYNIQHQSQKEEVQIYQSLQKKDNQNLNQKQIFNQDYMQNKKKQQKQEINTATSSKIQNLKQKFDEKKSSFFNKIGNLSSQIKSLKNQAPKINKDTIKSMFNLKFF